MNTVNKVQVNANFSVQLKPVGSSCNIKCDYCYVEPFKTGDFKIMPLETLEILLQKTLENSEYPTFSWHGGEPTLAGIDFFDRAMRIIKKHKKKGQKVRNMIQTNGILITPTFAEFFKRNHFGVSISIDGPKNIHGANRVTYNGKNTFKEVMNGLTNLRRAGISPSVICTVTQKTLAFTSKVFDFLIACGFKKIKFSPVFDSDKEIFNINSEEWFSYLSIVFDKWFALEDPTIQIRELDEVILWLQNKTLTLCSSDQSCLSWISVDPDGNLYPCEYLRSDYSYGNIRDIEYSEIKNTRAYKGFLSSFLTIPAKCKKCEFYSLCGNGCPATRILSGNISPEGIYAFCEERKMLYTKIKSSFEQELGCTL